MTNTTLDYLARLVGHASLTDAPNGGIIDEIAAHLQGLGARVHRVWDARGDRSGLLAALGPAGPGGVMLSGHVDVVPVAGQDWSGDPFRLRRDGGRVYGRGTTDMKGFLAAMLRAADLAAELAVGQTLAQPLKLAFSWDEEIGCRGIPVMLEQLDATIGAPDLVIVGEPTELQIALGHKGKLSARAVCIGQAGHSAQAPDYANAIHMAADVIALLRTEQAWLRDKGARDGGFDLACSTVHAGMIQGGRALNIVPDRAEIAFEIRNLAAEPVADILARIEAATAALAARWQARFPGTGIGIGIEVTGAYPGLDTDAHSAAVRQMQALLPEAGLTRVSFGTEAGHFAARGLGAVVCGPGSMAQGHKADEFIEIAQLDACDRMLARLVAGLARAG